MRFWYENYKSERECNPTWLDGNSLIRKDNVIIKSKEEIMEICTHCMDKEKCIQRLKEMKTLLFSKLYKDGVNPHSTKGWWTNN